MTKCFFFAVIVGLTTTDTLGVTFPWGSLGIGAILAWYLWYDTTRTRPAERKAHNEHVEKVIHDSEQHNADQLERFDTSLAAERDLRREMIERFHGRVE
jgi:hypothetical protein